jgi:signal transduction histidine kinase
MTIPLSAQLTESMTIPVSRGQRVTAGRGIRLAALRVPLAAKLVGANLFVVAVLVALFGAAGVKTSGLIAIGIAAVVVVHLVLVLVALRPIRELEGVASRVWRGDFAARVGRSTVADNEVLRIGSMFNILLDGLASDRARMRALATDVIEAGERERAALARELQDSTAQHVAALLFELAAAARDANDPALAERLRASRDYAESILEEVRLLSHTVHPAVLDDLGLEAALRKLGRDAGYGNVIDFDVAAEPARDRLPRNVEAALYRVAQEAVRNATRHASPRHVRISLRRERNNACLEIHDDGAGFDLKEVERRGRDARGLAAMRERLSLVDGWVEVKTARGSGTTVSATVPLDAAPDTLN